MQLKSDKNITINGEQNRILIVYNERPLKVQHYLMITVSITVRKDVHKMYVHEWAAVQIGQNKDGAT